MRVTRALLLAAAATGALAEPARAQETAGLTIRATRRDTIVATATVSAAFMIGNARPDTAVVRLRFALPAEWMPLTGEDGVVVAPGASEMVIAGVVVPNRTLAGTYPVRVWVTSTRDPRGTMDSLLVRVPERTAMEVTLQDRPGYVVSGRAYETAFQVRNRGNQGMTLHLASRSSVSSVSLSDTTLTLAPGESRLLRARSRTPAGMGAAVDDVVEIVARYASRPDVEPIRASSRVTVVPEPSRTIENFLRLPARVNVRAATSDGVAPVEIFGQGLVRDRGDTRLDFLFRAPTGPASAFGERDEYRVEMRAPDWRVRGGDHVFALSSLTTAGQPGFGVGADGDRGIFSAGVYGQQFRRVPEKGSEGAAFVAIRPGEMGSVSLNVVDRRGGALEGGIASVASTLRRGPVSSDVEYARSSSASGRGVARSVRIGGALPGGFVSFDAGHLYADTAFSGSQRGAEHNYLTANTAQLGIVSFGMNGSDHRTDLSRATGVPYEELFRTASISATVFERFTLEAAQVGRATVISGARADGLQRGLRGRADHDFPAVTLSLEVEGGTHRDTASRAFHDVGIGVRRGFHWGGAAIYGNRYSGGSLTKGVEAARTVGGDATVRLGGSLHATVIAYATRQETAGAEWHSQLDAILSKGVRNGGIVTLRARLLGGGSRTASQQSVMYLEYGMPLRLPVSPLRTPGRVTGRVVDATSGQGVPGALVRLGPQVAITDRKGEVSFGGVPGGQHRLSMSQETSFTNAVFMGDPTILVDSANPQPTRFSLSIARSARVDVDVRRFVLARTALAGGADSLSETGGVGNVTLILAGERDTLYRTTGENGRAVFTDIPPGRWVITVRGDMPAFTRFEPDRLELALEPGAVQQASFRLVPRRREVQIIGDGEELRPTSSDPRSATQAGSPTKAVKPDERRP